MQKMPKNGQKMDNLQKNYVIVEKNLIFGETLFKLSYCPVMLELEVILA
jgi:hypothetical protein